MSLKLGFTIAVVLFSNVANSQTTKPEPYSCQAFREAEKKCAAATIGKCYVQSEMDRLRQQCIREGGRPS